MRDTKIFIVIFFLIGCGKNIVETPRIEFKEKEFDFGEIAPVDKITHIFKFKNIGGDTLIIKSVRAP